MFNYNWQRRVVAATPMISLIVFLTLGFGWNLWNPGWIAFLAIPIMPFIVGLKKLRLTYPLVVIIAYLIMGLAWDLWHPGWIIFLTIPVFQILTAPNPADKMKSIKVKSKTIIIDSDDNDEE